MVINVADSFAQKFNWNNNLVIAHRGAWKKLNFPQNSIASLNQAVKLGCYGTEFDVWITVDQVLVVNHDADFYGIAIEKSTYQQLLAKSHPNGEKIPTLANYLQAGMRQHSTKLILEVKPSEVSKERGLILATKCVEMVTELNATAWVEYISFDYDACKTILALAPNAKVAYLGGDVSASQLKHDKLTGADYNLAVFNQNKNLVKEAHALALTVNVWTVNQLADIRQFLNLGVDFITTNEPELVFEEMGKQS